MQDRPTAAELADAVREFLKGEILPTLTDPRGRFHMLVAMNALGILEREFLLEKTLLETEHELLTRLLGDDTSETSSPQNLEEQVLDLNRRLAESLRAGEAPERTLECLKETVANKLKVASPRYLERYENGT